jgi:ribosome-associated toxin RatA of RatAB toxin-antitoxin module
MQWFGRPAGSSLWGLGVIPFTVLAALLFYIPINVHAEDLYLSLQTTGQGIYTVEGRFWTPADAPTIWSTLSDYEHLPQFVTSMKESRIRERKENRLLVDQVADGKALVLFHRRIHILLQVHEQPYNEIDFEDTLLKDFKSYRGCWKIVTAAGGGSWVDYRLEAKPNFFAPAPIARGAFQKMAKELMTSVETEILRRGHLGDTQTCCSQH